MALLDDDQVKRMREHESVCGQCERHTGRNYCRSCDLFFDTGHAPDCSLNDEAEHKNCRTY